VLYPAAWIIVPVWAALGTWTVQGYIPPVVALVLAVLGASWGFGQMFHRWAHLRRPAWPIRWLQGLGLIIRPGPHDAHHTPPYSTDYAVVTGWSNPVFDALRVPVLIDAVMRGLGFSKRDQALPDYEGTRA
jgi:ubiquitin-conjugating enzyme E2 variant